MFGREQQHTVDSPWFEPLKDLQSQVNALYSDLFADPRLREPHAFRPPMNLYQEGRNLVVEFAIPGVRKDSIQLTCTRDSMTLRGQVRADKPTAPVHYFSREMEPGPFVRIVQFPVRVDPHRVKAQLRDGVLRATIPLQDKPRRSVHIPIE